jgi:hypothetical protein
MPPKARRGVLQQPDYAPFSKGAEPLQNSRAIRRRRIAHPPFTPVVPPGEYLLHPLHDFRKLKPVPGVLS